MKRKVLIIGGMIAATAFFGGWALAQSTGHGPRGFGPGGFGPGGMQGIHGQMGPGMWGRMGANMNGGPGLGQFNPARIDNLKTELGITAAQEPAWIKYVKVIQDAAAVMRTAREGVDPDAVGKMSPQDRSAFVTKLREQRETQFETVQTAANELLVTLDDAQKAKARDTLPGLAAFGPGMMRNAMRGPLHHPWNP